MEECLLDCDYGANWPKIQSAQYRKSLEKSYCLSRKLLMRLKTRARGIFNNWDGRKMEKLYAIKLGKGVEMACVLGQQFSFEIDRT